MIIVLKYFVRVFPVLAWAGMIFMLSSMGDFGLPKSPTINVLSYVWHFSQFFVLATLSLWALEGKADLSAKPLMRTGIIITWVFSVMYAAGDEIHQLFVEGRDSSLIDFAVDVLGIATALFVLNGGILCAKKGIRNLSANRLGVRKKGRGSKR